MRLQSRNRRWVVLLGVCARLLVCSGGEYCSDVSWTMDLPVCSVGEMWDVGWMQGLC